MVELVGSQVSVVSHVIEDFLNAAKRKGMFPIPPSQRARFEQADGIDEEQGCTFSRLLTTGDCRLSE